MKEYTRPELEITEFELEDVLTTVSLNTNNKGGGEGGWH